MESGERSLSTKPTERRTLSRQVSIPDTLYIRYKNAGTVLGLHCGRNPRIQPELYFLLKIPSLQLYILSGIDTGHPVLWQDHAM